MPRKKDPTLGFGEYWDFYNFHAQPFFIISLLFDHLAEKEKRRTSKVNISWEILAPIIGLQLILMTVALVSCVKEEETNGPKWLWILIIVCINLIGPVLYFILGRKRQ